MIYLFNDDKNSVLFAWDFYDLDPETGRANRLHNINIEYIQGFDNLFLTYHLIDSTKNQQIVEIIKLDLP